MCQLKVISLCVSNAYLNLAQIWIWVLMSVKCLLLNPHWYNKHSPNTHFITLSAQNLENGCFHISNCNKSISLGIKQKTRCWAHTNDKRSVTHRNSNVVYIHFEEESTTLDRAMESHFKGAMQKHSIFSSYQGKLMCKFPLKTSWFCATRRAIYRKVSKSLKLFSQHCPALHHTVMLSQLNQLKAETFTVVHWQVSPGAQWLAHQEHLSSKC